MVNANPSLLKDSDYIGITVDKFNKVAETYRNKDIWKKDNFGRWELKDDIGKA